MIQIFDSMTELLESVPKENMTFEMCNAFVKAWGKIHGYGGGKSEVHPFTMYPKIMVSVSGGADQFRPIFWFKKDDKKAYEEAFGIVHSDCYCKYGLDRTGCACCPFGKFFERELAVAEQFEPNLYRAAIHVFGKSYEYTRQYREFQKKMEGGAE